MAMVKGSDPSGEGSPIKVTYFKPKENIDTYMMEIEDFEETETFGKSFRI
jgi:hypothetical protein